MEARSSSNDLSSAPNSDIEGPFGSRPTSSHQQSTIIVVQDLPAPTSAYDVMNGKAHGSSATAARQESAAVKPRKPRKKKDVDPNAPPPPEKEKKPRKPRASAGTGTTSRSKKLKTENQEAASIPQHTPQTTDLSTSRLIQPAPFVTESKPLPPPTLYEAAKPAQNGVSNTPPVITSQPQSPTAPRYNGTTSQPQPSAPRSTAVFDPVRGIAIDRPIEYAQPSTSQNLTPPRPTFRPSASPAISSIINPPDTKDSTTPAIQQPHFSNNIAHLSSSIAPSANVEPPNHASNAMELDVPISQTRKSSTSEKPAVEQESKPKRAKEQPPPLPTGSGLLSSSLFGGESGSTEKTGNEKAPNIVIHVDLKNPDNKVINFARLAEEKYGFAALYPRQAAQKERLAKVAALGNALEKSASSSKKGGTSGGESGDEDLSVDIDRDSDNDGDVAMTGLNGGPENSGTDGPAPKQRRKRKDEYDADDPFVDDSEMLWEAQAAASKDGFFVYCGPLVPEGEKPAVERADGTIKRGRGRGRGGGPGSRGGRGGAASARASEEGSSRGGGPGSRGGGITRKPRITKAERAQRELEKKQREANLNLAAKPTAYSTA